MSTFTIDHRYKHIGIGLSDRIDEIEKWCYNTENGDFTVMITGIVYKNDHDLTAFLLKWA